MSREIARKIVEDIYSDTYISLKEDVSKIISEKAVDVLQDMKSHVAKKFFSLGEDYNAPDATGTTSYSSIRDFGRDVAQQARGQRPTRSDQAIAAVGRRAETGTGRREAPAPVARPVGQAPAPATPAQGGAAARGDDMRNPPTSRPAAAPAARPAARPAAAPAAAPAARPAAAPAARPAAAPAARPAAGSQGVTGSEVAARSGGQFMTRADRTNQAKVDSVLGPGNYKAGSAEANLALRNYYRQQSQGRGAAAVSPETRAAADRLQRPERDEGEQEALRQRRAAERATADSLGGPG